MEGMTVLGKTISHYKIHKKLCEGGMSEVYLADDTRLNRRVAIKFLPTHLIANQDVKSRFYREAQAVAKLNHPNIVTTHDVGEINGTPYIVMEFVDGVSLFDSKPDCIPKIISVCQAVCTQR